MAEPKAADATVSLTVMHVSPSGGPSTWGSGWGRSAADQDDVRDGEVERWGWGWGGLEIFLEAASEGAKMEQNLYLRVKIGVLRPHVLETLVQMQGAQTASPKEQVRGSFPLNPCFFYPHRHAHTHRPMFVMWPLASDLTAAYWQSSLDCFGARGRHQHPPLW